VVNPKSADKYVGRPN